jgi:hypothetical protein
VNRFVEAFAARPLETERMNTQPEQLGGCLLVASRDLPNQLSPELTPECQSNQCLRGESTSDNPRLCKLLCPAPRLARSQDGFRSIPIVEGRGLLSIPGGGFEQFEAFAWFGDLGIRYRSQKTPFSRLPATTDPGSRPKEPECCLSTRLSVQNSRNGPTWQIRLSGGPYRRFHFSDPPTQRTCFARRRMDQTLL